MSPFNQPSPGESPPVQPAAGRRLLLTGATGFVGVALAGRLSEEQRYLVRAAVRRESKALPACVEQIVLRDFTAVTDWQGALRGVAAVVHLAARTHVTRETVADPLGEYRRANTDVTLNLARQALAAGVRRFVFMSSVKVNGEGRLRAGQISRESDPPAPEDAYGLSKHEAEIGLRDLAAASGMEVVIIRPPLVYGPGVRANFGALMRAVAKGIPLPLGALDNKRSFIGVDNLVDFILIAAAHPAAANETFLVSDGEDISTPELIRRLARAMDRPVRLIPVPAAILAVAATLVGKQGMARRLLGSLQVDISKAKQVLGWVPPVSLDAGLKLTVAPLLLEARGQTTRPMQRDKLK